MSPLTTFQIVITGQVLYEKKEGNTRYQFDYEFLYRYGENTMSQQISPIVGHMDTYWDWHLHGRDTDDDFSIEAYGYRAGKKCGFYISGNDLFTLDL